MLLKSGKIYKRNYFRDAYLCPTLQIVGAADIYVSNKSEKPESVSEMVQLEDINANSLQVFTGMTRWIAAVYNESEDSDDDGNPDNAVYEMGLVENPYRNN